MAGNAPTFDELWTQFGLVTALLVEVDAVGNANSPNLLDLEAAINVGVGEGLYTPEVQAIVKGHIDSVSGVLSRASVRALYRPVLRDMAHLATGQEARTGLTNEQLLAIVRKYMVDNSKTIKSRGLTLSAPTATGSPTGTGTILRLTTDKDGDTLEGVGVELLTFECDKAQNSGAKEFAEEFKVTGLSRYPNALQWTGSALAARLRASHARSLNLLKNPSFDKGTSQTDNTALTAVSDVTDWVAATAANWKWRSDAVDAAYIYRGHPNAPSVKWSLENTASDSLTQTLLSVNKGAVLKKDVPYFLRVSWKKKGSTTGTLSIAAGSQSTSVDVSTGVDDTFEHLYLALGTKCWLENFDLNDLTFVLTTATIAVGTLVLDDVVLDEMTLINGNWYVCDGGATPFVLGDKWTAATSGGAIGTGKNAYELWRGHGAAGYLPAAGSPTQADPT